MNEASAFPYDVDYAFEGADETVLTVPLAREADMGCESRSKEGSNPSSVISGQCSERPGESR